MGKFIRRGAPTTYVFTGLLGAGLGRGSTPRMIAFQLLWSFSIESLTAKLMGKSSTRKAVSELAECIDQVAQ